MREQDTGSIYPFKGESLWKPYLTTTVLNRLWTGGVQTKKVLLPVQNFPFLQSSVKQPP